MKRPRQIRNQERGLAETKTTLSVGLTTLQPPPPTPPPPHFKICPENRLKSLLQRLDSERWSFQDRSRGGLCLCVNPKSNCIKFRRMQNQTAAQKSGALPKSPPPRDPPLLQTHRRKKKTHVEAPPDPIRSYLLYEFIRTELNGCFSPTPQPAGFRSRFHCSLTKTKSFGFC